MAVGDLRRHVGQQRDHLAGALLQLMHARGDLGREDFGLADLVDAGDQERIARQEIAHAEAPRAAGDQMMVAVGRGDVAQDLGDGADLMQMLRAGRVDRGVLLQQHADRPVGFGGLLRARDRLRAAERDRHDDAREEHGVARRHEDQRAFGELQLLRPRSRQRRALAQRTARAPAASAALRLSAAWSVRCRSWSRRGLVSLKI